MYHHLQLVPLPNTSWSTVARAVWGLALTANKVKDVRTENLVDVSTDRQIALDKHKFRSAYAWPSEIIIRVIRLPYKDMGTKLLCLVSIVTLLAEHVDTGTWELLNLDSGTKFELGHIGWSPYERRSMIFGAMACTEVALNVYTKSGNSYFIIYIGYYSNTYALIIPSADCDADGNCNIANFSPGTYLDCSDYRFFWVSWDLAGNVALGTDYTVGANTIIAITNGLTEEAVYANFEISDVYGGSVYLSVENDPVFLNPAPDESTEITMTETSTVGTVLYTIATSDPDGDTVTGYILDDSTTFTFSGNDLTNLVALDYETECSYHVKITIHDGANMVNTTLTINLVNAFDEAPNVDAMSVSLPEELPIDSFIDSGLTVSDRDEGDQLTYTLTGAHAGYFQVTSDGRLKVAARIDFDPPNSITQLDQLTLTVTDLGSNTNSTTLTFSVKDVNDMKPLFSQPVYNAAVTEGAGTVSLLQMTITDADSGVNADFDVTMDGDDPSDPAFTFDPTTLQLSVDANKLDYESLEATDFMSTLTFVATDKATEYEPRTGTTIAVIKVDPQNEHSPVWTTQPADTSVSETAPGGFLVDTYTATDDDFTEHGDVTYGIVSITSASGSDGSGLFSLDSKSGELRVTSPLDADTSTGGHPSYVAVIKASDCCSKNVQASVTITLTAENDNAPAFTQQIYYAELMEADASGDVVAEATDADGDALTFSLSGEGSDMFYYAPPKVHLNNALDFETQRYFFLTLRANDGVHETDVAVNINVTDILDEPTVITVHNPLSLVEELPVDSPIGGVFDATDKDKDELFTYSLEGTESTFFNIDSASGLITIAQRIDRDAGLTSITDVTLKVTDAVLTAFSQPLTFDVVDINDNSPQFTSDVIFANVTENTGIDTLLKTFSVTDDDDGDNSNVVVSVVSGDDANPNEKFRLNGLELLTTSTAVDYEALSSANFLYTLTVQAVDQPTTEAAKTAVAVVVLTVLPENEFTPVFTAPTATDVAISETSQMSSVVETFSATDDDNGEDGRVVYEITTVTDPSGADASTKFFIEEATGVLRVAEGLDVDVMSGGVAHYDITVTATDKGLTPKSATQSLRVTLQNENDLTPEFIDFTYFVNVPEDTSVNDVILTFSVRDGDGDTVTASLVDGETSLFSVAGTDVTLAQKLDYETSSSHSLVISISDGVHTANQTLVVRVTDVIDEPPIVVTFTPVFVTEELPVETAVDGLFHMTDLDKDDSWTFTLQGSDSPYFTINATSGSVKLAQRIDLEALAGDSVLDQLTLTVTDQAGLQATASLSVEIQDINDAYPTFAESVYKVNISESSTTEVLVDLVATDADSGTNGAITMQITDGDDPGASKFQLSGTQLSALGADLDYEALKDTQYMYILTVSAADSPSGEAPKTGVTLVVVSILPVNEHAPVWTAARVVKSVSGGALPDLNIMENVTVGSGLLTLQATDNDHGVDGDVTYTITSAVTNTGASAIDLFALNPVTGTLRTAGNLDRDITTGEMYYDLILTARDGGNPYKETSATLKIILDNVNDNAPVFTSADHRVDVAETTPVGTVIHTFAAATDVDGDAITYSIVRGHSDVFGTTGVTVVTLLQLDYEQERCYSLVIQASDGTHGDNVTMTINVTDVIDEQPVITVHDPLTIPEELTIGSKLSWAYDVIDKDKNDSLIYTLTGSDAGYFSLDSTTGQLTVAQRLDREVKAVLDTLTLHVEDSVGLTADASLAFTITDINDNAPKFAQDVHVVYVAEGGTAEVDLVTFVVDDVDVGDNAAFNVSITSGNDGSEFRLDGLVLKGDSSMIDYETPAVNNYTYILSIQAVDKPTDGGSRTGSTVVVVHIGPANEFDPTWVSPVPTAGFFPDLTIPETPAPTSSLVTYDVSDDDDGVHGIVNFSIVSATTAEGSDASSLFLVDPVVGSLWMTAAPDADTQTGGTSRYDVIISATDGGHRSIQATQTIHLTNTNDNPPTIWASSYAKDMIESTAVGDVVFTLEVKDIDLDTVTSSVTEGTDLFSFDGTSVTTTGILDFESVRCHTVVISVSDGVHDVNVTLTVNVTDSNDQTPEVTLHGGVSIPEEQPVGTIIGGLFDAIDEDEVDSLTYALSGTDDQYIEIDPNTGKLKVKARIDRDNGVTFLDDLTLTVTDLAGHSSSVNLNVTVLDINDNAPECTQTVFKVNITEGEPDGLVATLSCYDNDTGDNGNFVLSITDGDDLNYFSLVGLEIHAASSTIDYESIDTSVPYIVTLGAVDQPTTEAAKTGAVTIIAQILPVNEFDPTWVSPSPAGGQFPDVTISEAPLTTSIMIYNATDDDDGDHGKVTYHITSATTAEGSGASSLFLVDPVVGSLWMTTTPDADIQTGGTGRYEVIITAKDGGERSTQATQTIHVTNTNDNPPTIWTSVFHRDIPEDTAIGDVVFTLEVKDIDLDTVTSSVTEGADLFSFDGTSVTTTGILDFESVRCHTVVISASDGVHEVNVSLTINVTDVNDNAPEVTLHSSVSIPEELPLRTVIGGVYGVIDKDELDTLGYAVSGSHSQYVEIDSSTGELKVKARIDRDGSNGVAFLDDLTLTVTDLAGHSSSVNLNISVLDVNDNAPECSQTVFKINITEGEPDGLVATLSCYDNDTGDNGNFVLSITDGDDLNYFSLVGLEVHAASSTIDYESIDTSVPYIVTLGAVDQPTTEAAKTGAVTIIAQIQPQNEHSPVWTTPQVFISGSFPDLTLPEDTPAGSDVVKVTAVDDDAGADGDVIYEITSVTDETGVDRSSLFFLDKSTGLLKTSGVLDRDLATGGVEYFEIAVKASDRGTTPNAIETNLKLSLTGVNDNAPVFRNVVAEVTVNEAVPVGTDIYKLEAKDYDGDSVDFQITNGSANLFQVVGSDLRLLQELDYETQHCHTVEFSATDGTYTANVSLTINVGNVVDEEPVITLIPPLVLPEELPLEMNIGGFLSVEDPDEGDSLTFNISGTGSVYFTIDSSTGAFSIANRIDRDIPGNVTFIGDLTLTVTDSAGLRDTAALNFSVVDLNDNTPICEVTTGEVTVTENSASGVVLSEITCNDVDSGDFSTVAISIDSSSDPDGYFQLSGTKLITGVNAVDYEARESTDYTLNIKVLAIDNPSGDIQLTATSTVTIKVLPENERTPIFMTPVLNGSGFFPDVTVSEDITMGTVVTPFNATDGDHGDDGRIVYSVTSSITDSGAQVPGTFTIDASSGKLRVSGQLDADAVTGGVNYYVVNITATDAGSLPRSTHGALRVDVTGSNDNPPVWNITILEVHVYENASVGHDAVPLMADDVDGDTVTFSTSHTKFKVDGSMLKVDQQLDFEQERCHAVVVSATDGTYSVNQTIVVHVLDSNDETPVVTVTKTIYIPEEIPVGTDVARGHIVIDADNSDTLAYSLQGADSGLLAINSSTGEITLKEVVDYENLVSGNLDVVLHVGDAAGHTVTQALDIVVTDVNDNTPVFSKAVHRVHVAENSTGETLLLTLTVTDADSGTNGLFTFNISDGNNDGLFRLDGDDLYVNVVDYESASSIDFTYSLTVTAVDHAADARTGVTVVIVEVTPENEFAPLWSSPSVDGARYFPSVVVDEDVSPDYDVVTVTATDADLGEDGEVTYSITSVVSDMGVNMPGVFIIESGTGKLKTSSSLDFDQSTGGVKYYDVTITVSDKGSVPKTTSAIQRVNLTNVNDIAPKFVNDTYTVNVACTDVAGSSVVTLSADDEDSPSLVYEIEAGTNQHVSVDSASGEVTLIVPPTGVTVEELVQSIPLLVSDQGTPNLQGKGHLLVVFENCETNTECNNDTNDFTPMFSKSLHTVAVPENATGETLILTFTATDADNGTNGQFTFNISDGNNDGLFRLDGDDLYVNIVDYESSSSIDFTYSLTVTAVDHAADARTGVTVVIVEVTPENEFAPLWSSPSVDGARFFPSVVVDEDVSPDYDVVTVTATDADLGEDGEVTYSITSVVSDTGVNMPGVFIIESGTGKLKTSSSLDFDQSTGGVKYYDVTITVSDKGSVPKNTSGIQRVNLTNVNDIAPKFVNDTYTVNVACTDVVGSSVVTLSADDEDSPSLVYEIEAGTNQHVSVDSASGEVTLTASTTGVTVEDLVQSIPLLVSDQGTPNLQGKGHLLVVFENCQTNTECNNDTNVHTPMFSKSLHTVAVPENGTGESLILTFSATDADNGTNGQFSFNIIDGNNDGLFRLDGDDLYVQVVDYEGSASVNFTYTLIVTVVDHAADAKTGVTVVVVEISPQNEFDPVYQSPKPDSSGEFPALTVDENVPLGHEVIVVTATDADLGVDGHVVYSIDSVLTDAGASEPNKFSIDPSSGRLTTSSQLDFDPSTGGTSYYNVTILASDMGSTPRSVAVLQTVIVQNINDIQPALSVTMTTVNVPCGTAAGTSLVTLTAVDDDGPNLNFAIDSGSNPYVSVSNSGEVTLLSSPVGSAVDDLVENIQVLVSDGGTPELTVTGHVQILFENCGNSTVCSSVTTATTTKAATCDCNNMTTTEDTPPSRSTSDVIETWIMRAAVMLLTAVLFGVLAMQCRPKTPRVPQKSRGKVFPRENTLERGIQDDAVKPFDDDLEHHFLHK
ncbi:protocadherin Fat 4-like [Haliotis asinina]|uniref:protocadherin Fat 4-like n=1 Tax=Haliotis asinina TaxID=109174 RepID=UPI00353254A7